MAFDVGRTLRNTDLSRDFMELVVIDGSVGVGGSWRGTQRETAWDRVWPGLV